MRWKYGPEEAWQLVRTKTLEADRLVRSLRQQPGATKQGFRQWSQARELLAEAHAICQLLVLTEDERSEA